MTLTRIDPNGDDMGDSYDCWAGSDPHAVALHARATATANPGLIEEFQSRVADQANAWLDKYARDTADVDDEAAREFEISDYNDAMNSVDVEAIAAELLVDDDPATAVGAWVTTDPSCLLGGYVEVDITVGGDPIQPATATTVPVDADDYTPALEQADEVIWAAGYERVSDWTATSTGFAAELARA